MRILILVFLLLLGWLQYRLWVGEGSLAEVTALRHEITAQGEELEKLRTRNRRLQAEVDDLRQGQDALEERARSELGMIKGGEIFLQVIEPTPGVGAPGAEATATPPASKAKAPQAAPHGDSKAVPNTEPKSEAKPTTKPVTKPVPKPEARTVPQSEAKTTPKAAAKPEPKPTTKPKPGPKTDD
jgi:cell division protein FtsB